MFGKLKAKIVSLSQNETVRTVAAVVTAVVVISVVSGAVQAGTREVDQLLTSIIHSGDKPEIEA